MLIKRMSKIFQLALIMSLLLPVMACAEKEAVSAAPSASETRAAPKHKVFRENIQYTELFSPVPTSVDPGKVEVVEMFWYGCPHCFRLEPELQKWAKSKPADIELVRIPGVLNPAWKLGARVFYAAQTLGKLDDLHEALFQAIHEQHRQLRNEDAVIRFVESQGVDGKAFRDAMHSMAVDTKVARAEELARLYGVTGVPALVVGGKYRVLSNGVKSYEEMFEVVDFLADKVREEAKAERN